MKNPGYWHFYIGVTRIGYLDYEVRAAHTEESNQPPDRSAARPSLSTLWPPDKLVSVEVLGVTDPDDREDSPTLWTVGGGCGSGATGGRAGELNRKPRRIR